MELFDTKQETNNKVTVVDNRKLNVGLALSSNYLNTESIRCNPPRASQLGLIPLQFSNIFM